LAKQVFVASGLLGAFDLRSWEISWPTYDERVSSAAVPVRGYRWARGLAVTLVLGAVLTGCRSNDAAPIVVGAVGRSTVVEVVEAPAAAVPNATTTVTSPASGMVARLRVHDGQTVSAGRVLLVIDSPQAQRALAQAKAAQAAAAGSTVSINPIDVTAQRQQADAAAARAFDAARQAARAIPDPTTRAQALAQIASAQAQYRAAAAQAATALAQVNAGITSVTAAASSLGAAQQTQTALAVQAAQRAVDGLRVRAPIAGRVVLGTGSGGGSSAASSLAGSLPSGLASQAQSLLGGGSSSSTASASVHVGSPVSAGSTLLTVTDSEPMTLRAQVDETDILLVHPGVRADVQFDAVSGATYQARVLVVDINPTTSSRGGVAYPVSLALGPGHYADGRLAPRPLPGMSAVAALQVRRAVNAIAVPASAVFREGTQDFVWLVTGGVARKHAVTLGAQGEADVQVISGLSEGDQIVTHGADQVSDGQSVP
jgi:HlyD family secretion protein